MLNMNAINKAIEDTKLFAITSVESIDIENILSNNGNIVANQFIITIKGNLTRYRIFQSYQTVIAVECANVLILDEKVLDYSTTTLKYLNIFLGISVPKRELQKRIDQSYYLVADLNK